MKNLVSIVCVIGMLLSGIQSIHSNAVELVEPCTEITEEPSAGLIWTGNVSVSNYNGSLRVNANVNSYTIMEIIGLKDVKVQYSYNNNQWYDEWNVGDFLTYNTNQYELSNYIMSLERSGCYYRIECKCYAKKAFLNTQSETVTSNSVWIS